VRQQLAAMSYDGVAYPLAPVASSKDCMNAIFRAMDPFQNAENAWRRSLNYLGREWDTQCGRFM
jgi:hypothetical protein